MTIKPLRRLNQDDLSNNVVHFTGRLGRENTDVPREILRLSGRERLISILVSREIWAFDVFGSWGDPVVCFTEATLAGMRELVGAGRYDAWGLEFSKDYVFRHGGGPVLYVRGDQWDGFCQSDLPPETKALGTKYWPGVVWSGEGWRPMSTTLNTSSEWAHEREWRIPVTRPDEGAPAPRVTFSYADLSAIVTPSVSAGEELRAALPASVRLDLESTPVLGLSTATRADETQAFVVRLQEIEYERAAKLFARMNAILAMHPGPRPLVIEIERSGGGVSRLVARLRVDGSAQLKLRLEGEFAPILVVRPAPK